MSEQNNSQAYTAKVQKYLENGTPFVPFLGVFLTQVSLSNIYNHQYIQFTFFNRSSKQRHIKTSKSQTTTMLM